MVSSGLLKGFFYLGDLTILGFGCGFVIGGLPWFCNSSLVVKCVSLFFCLLAVLVGSMFCLARVWASVLPYGPKELPGLSWGS